MDRRSRDHAPAPPRTYEGRVLPNQDEEVYDQGLAFDLDTLMSRRGMLKLVAFTGLGAVGLGGLVACGGSSGPAVPSTAPSTAATVGEPGTTVAAGDCEVIPEETAGPYPGDGSNGPDVLSQSGVARRDMTSSFGELSGTAEGVPLTIRLALQDASGSCAPLAGAAVYAWHCDRDGQYSLYTITDQNYLRGVQGAGDDGVVTFLSIFPGCYPGRWPHVHFEVYPSLGAATDDANRIATSQLAFPADACERVYATSGYEQSIANLQQVSLETDNVFGDDGGVSQIGAMGGTVDGGLTVELAVPVSA